MNKIVSGIIGSFMLLILNAPTVLAQDSTRIEGPTTYVFATVDGKDLKAHVFRPTPRQQEDRSPAIVIFHGGGWASGEPGWAFGRAQHFAALGMVAVAAQYRLSDQKTVTPLEAMADARAVIRWMRSNAKMLGIDPNRIVADGSSAGAHLAASAAIFDDSTRLESISAVPNALILVSPAVYLESDGWVIRLLGGRADVSSISPVSHVRPGLPPTLILEGSEDTVTPLKGVQLFCDRMRAAGNRCDMHVYPDVGHLFTPKGIRDDEWPQPDPKIKADAQKKADEFLVSLGYVK